MLNQTKAEVMRQREELEEENTLRKELKRVLEEAAVALKEALRVRVNINRSIIIWCYSQVNKQQSYSGLVTGGP